MVSALDKKLLRDLSRLKGQVVTIALVVAAGIAAFVAMKGNYASLEHARDAYYERSRFADVFRISAGSGGTSADLRASQGLAGRHPWSKER
jgi:putative ABC transport system permease protein